MAELNRDLSPQEQHVFNLIQEIHGDQNTIADVFGSLGDESCIFIKDEFGKKVLMANLTNLGRWQADGSIASDKELRENWLRR